jgi:hypothetical protein
LSEELDFIDECQVGPPVGGFFTRSLGVFLLGALTVFQIESLDSNLRIVSKSNASINVIIKKWDLRNIFRCAKQYTIEL